VPLVGYKGFWHRLGLKAVIIGQLSVVIGFHIYRQPLTMSMMAIASWKIHEFSQGKIYMSTLDRFEGPVITLALLAIMLVLHLKMRNTFVPDPPSKHT
jgi:hypothetical protein